MNSIVKISLISKTYTTNSIGVSVVQEVPTDVFAQMYSVSQTEFYKAGQEGLKPAAVFAVRSMEYNGQESLDYNNVRYTIYRTFARTDGRTELYTNRRKGTNDIIST